MSRFFHFIGRVFDFLIKLTGRLLFLLFLIGLIFLLVSGPEPMQVPDDGLVVINPRGAIVEQSGLVAPGSLLMGATDVNSTSVRDIVEALQLAAVDDRVNGAVLDLTEMGEASPAVLEAIGAALDEFKAADKTLVAYSAYYSQPQYLLASYADTVYLHPMGQLLLPGYGGSQLFFADLLDRLGVNVHIFRVGTHKAAVEPFMLNGMSDESRSNNQQLADELWQHYLDQVALNRGLSESAVRDYAANYPAHLLAAGGNTARVAVEHGLIDELVSQPRFQDQLRALVGNDAAAHTIEFQQYLALTRRPQLPSQNEIGVIVAQGTIDVGEQPRGMIGADSINELIREARNNDRIKALVLRIDSPGGSALASELIREELMQLQATGKPLVVSMGGTAASGGYWIAATADEIWASPVTITGSIGIFGVVPTFENSLDELGVHTDGVSTTPMTRADVFSGLTEPMAAVFQASVEDGYRRFLDLVATGRGLTVAEVDAIAQGQVWSGSQARDHGLVDNLGGLDGAIGAAARLAGLEDYQHRLIEKPLTPAELFMQQLVQNMGMTPAMASVQTSLAGTLGRQLPAGALGAWHDLLDDFAALARFNDPLDLYSLCEFCAALR